MTDILDQINQARRDWRKNPLLCVHTLFTDYLTFQQKDIIKAVFRDRRTVVKSGHGLGKSYIAALTALAFLYTFYPSKVITLAPSWSQVEKILWVEIAKIYHSAKVGKYLGGVLSNTKLELDKNWFAFGLSPKLDANEIANRLTGFREEYLLVILDEACSIDERIWEVVSTLLTGANCRLLAIGNPTKISSKFYKMFAEPGVRKITLNIFRSPNFMANKIYDIDALRKIAQLPYEEREACLDKMENPLPALTTVRWAAERMIDWGENSILFQSRVLAEFPKQASDGIISLADLERCNFASNLKPSIKALGVDPARVKDRCVYFGIHNYEECYRKITPGHDLMQIRNEIVKIHREENFQIIAIDSAGLGIGLYDALVELKTAQPTALPRILPVNFGSAPTSQYKTICTNLVSELWYRLSKLIEAQEILLQDKDTLFSELINRRYVLDKYGKIAIEDKEKYKARAGGQSPDIADAVLYALAGIFFGTSSFSGIQVLGDRVSGSLEGVYA